MLNAPTRNSMAAVALALVLPTAAFSQSPAPAAPEMAEAEVRKVDLDNKKLTLKHGPIKNLDMPGMTMVFKVRDPAVLSRVKAGDKVRFTAEKVDGSFTITGIEAAN